MIPDCRTGADCAIPPLSPAAARALEIHGRLRRLKDLNLAPHICQMYQVDEFDLELLAVIEDQLKEFSQPATDHGE
jgi:hypothetical protein